MARAAEVIPRLSMPIYEPLHIFRRAPHGTRSHSFASVISPGRSVGSAVIITIFPVLSISIRATCTPAALTALTALVTSCWRNVDGARAITPLLHQQIERECERLRARAVGEVTKPGRISHSIEDIAHFKMSGR